MKVTKQSTKIDEHKRAWFDFPRARDALESYLSSLNMSDSECILIPNYIGYSEREGSGVFDPIVNSGVNYKFYELDHKLEMDKSSIIRLIELGNVRLLVVIHYFGYVDPRYQEIIGLAKKNNVRVLEDQAHSLLTDIYGGVTGRQCDASIYSLHKMFPVEGGGALSLTGSKVESDSSNVSKVCLEYDIYNISVTRIRNFNILLSKLSGHEDVLSILRTKLEPGVVPQTFPILIKNKNRDELYSLMNNSGFGVVSLYHTLIGQIEKCGEFRANMVSEQILNLPLHQGASEEALSELCDFLLNILYMN